MGSGIYGKGGFVRLTHLLLAALVFGVGIPALGQIGGQLQGDINEDGVVDLDDFVLLKLNFGRTKYITLDLGDGVTMELVNIPSGTFMMGSPETEQDRWPEEGPQHQVTITQPFYMGTYEVTIGQYLAYLNAGGDPSGVDFADGDCPVEAYGDSYRMKTSSGAFWGNLNQPMVEVSWSGARSFSQWLADRTGRAVTLPTEAQWEYACRAGSTTRFYYGDDADYSLLGKYAWYVGNSASQTHPVGQKTPNAWGLYDMHGNVWEWCKDWYGSYASANVVDPHGPASGSYRVIRGGGWVNVARDCRSAKRGWNGPENTYDRFGFRVVVAPRGLD